MGFHWKDGWVDWIAIESVAELAVFIPSQGITFGSNNDPANSLGDTQIQKNANGLQIRINGL